MFTKRLIEVPLLGMLVAGLLLTIPTGSTFAQDVVDVEIEPSTISVPQGNCFSFTVSFTVPHPDPQTFRASAYVELPSGRIITLVGPRQLTVGAHSTLSLEPRLCVPRRAPLGDYILTVEARDLGGSLLDSDSLAVTVEAGTGPVENWDLRDF